jgi:hypothetical protein
MRLLNAKTLKLQEFHPGQEPEYSILSHTWGSREITYEDIAANGGRLPSTGASLKIRNFCRKASENNPIGRQTVSWVWVDTCCINKSSSSELQEAINSMFSWYKSASDCYVYLEDVQVQWDNNMLSDEALYKAKWRDWISQVKQARWLTRGWTLQEFIASKSIIFYDRDWKLISPFSGLRDELSDATRIPRSMLGSSGIDIEEFGKTSLQERIYWARNRHTTRPEDRAYSLLDLLNVSMPMIYGEGAVKAFKRLKREVKEEHGIDLNFEDLY